MAHPDESARLEPAKPRLTTEDVLSLRGIGWDGDLEQLRDDNPWSEPPDTAER